MILKIEISAFLIVIGMCLPSYSAEFCTFYFSDLKKPTYTKILEDIGEGRLSYIKFGVGIQKIYSLEDFAIARYGEEIGPATIEFLKSKNLQELILDAGIVLYLEDFKNFLNNSDLNESAWIIRKKFSNALGSRIVYRSMALSYAELRSIQTNGIISAESRKKNDNSSEIKNIQSALAYHSAGFSSASEFISVTDYPTLAVAVGKTFLKNENEKKLYLFKLEIPKLDLIFFDTIYKYQDHNLAIRINLSKKPVDYHLESFVFQSIEPQQIKGVTQISKPRQWFSRFNHITKDENLFSELVNQFRFLFN